MSHFGFGASHQRLVFLPWYYSTFSLGTYANAKIGIVHTMGRGGGEVSNQWHVELPERGYIVVVA